MTSESKELTHPQEDNAVEVLEEKEYIRFSEEAKEALKKKGYIIYELTGQSVKSFRDKGKKFWSSWHQNTKLEDLTSMLCEIAINPNQLFLPNSNNKTFSQQVKLVSDFSDKLDKEVEGVKAIIGEIPDYVELAFQHLNKTGEYLFGITYKYDYVRTKTPTAGNCVADVGGFHAEGGIRIGEWGRDRPQSRLWISPLAVPARLVQIVGDRTFVSSEKLKAA